MYFTQNILGTFVGTHDLHTGYSMLSYNHSRGQTQSGANLDNQDTSRAGETHSQVVCCHERTYAPGLAQNERSTQCLLSKSYPRLKPSKSGNSLPQKPQSKSNPSRMKSSGTWTAWEWKRWKLDSISHASPLYSPAASIPSVLRMKSERTFTSDSARKSFPAASLSAHKKKSATPTVQS